MGEPQLYGNHRANRKARIATTAAFVLLVLICGAPAVAAENEPTVEDDGSASVGACAGANPWRVPPDYYVDAEACLEPL